MKRPLRAGILIVIVEIGCHGAGPPVAVGTLERHRIELRAERQESIVRLAVKEGDAVEAGDVLVELDTRRVTALLGQAIGARDLAAARRAEVVRGARPEVIDLARAQLAETEAALVQLEPELERVQQLVAQGIESKSVLDAAQANHAAALARRDAARSSLEELFNGATVEELDQADAEVERTTAEVVRLEIDAARLSVTAPRAGTVDALPFKQGDEPPVGAAVVVLLTDDAPFARVYVPAELRPTVVAGRAATVAVDGYPNPFEGMPYPVQVFAEVLPLTHFLRIVRGIILRGATLREVSEGIWPLLVFFVIVMAAAMLRFQKKLD